MNRVLLLCMLLCAVVQTVAASALVQNVRLWDAPDHSRLVFELSKQVEHQLMMLPSPDRLVLDIKQATKYANFDSLDLTGSPIKRIRSARRNEHDLRVVLDLKESVQPKSFLLKPNEQYGDRLVIDLYPERRASVTESRPTVTALPASQRDIIVVIDPGHGGEDPGAIGPGYVKEKDVVLAISQALAEDINRKRGFKAYLTRERDYYIRLRDRTNIARKKNADLLVSVHADAFIKAQANGASVFAISHRGASSEAARWLAQKENAADLIGGVGGVSLEDKDDVLASVLLDLSSTASLKASIGVGEHVLKSLGRVARLHKSNVQQAGFVVLKSPDIPSILVETGFISNPAESRRLKTRKYQRQIAESISKGVEGYFEKTPPPGTLVAYKQRSDKGGHRSYTVQRGDTLSHIAMKNAVSIQDLRSINGLRSDQLRVGQRLRVPAS
ncbi:MAG: N-acetylmuramoyl-L-alanine amidase [Oleiphilaceae bacterium]|nr:N-acetylmuramoyl-L-alanine amidase [Oleiphilaceae bacterium]